MPLNVEAERWRARVAEALAAAARMTDPQARRIMWQIALGYEHLARHSEKRRVDAQPMRAVSYGPEALTAICQAFDDAWRTIAPTVGDDPLAVEAARLNLANALLAVADEASRDATVLKNAALQVMALAHYRR